MSKIRFGKIIFLADPDVDGRHINTLLLALFWKYLPGLFKGGHVYMVASPEYLSRYRDKVYFGSSPESIYKQCGSDKAEVRHIKGWGEIKADDMEPIAFQKGKRRLWQIMPPKDKKGQLAFAALMGKDSTYRKKLLGVV